MNDRGAVLVEFAFLAPIFVLLLFGIIDFGLVMRDTIAVRQGAREGARQGVVGTFPDSDCTLVGSEASGDTKDLMCLTKDRVGLNENDVRVKLVLGAGGYAKGEPLLVCVAAPLSSTTGLFSSVLNGNTSKTEVQMRIEDTVDPPLANAEETPPPGSDWSWCAL